MGPFIVFEGGEGSGKSTQADMLRRRLVKLGSPVVLTREPGGTALGNRLRRWIKWSDGIYTQTELLLLLAARSQLVAEVLLPALKKGSIVICDRYSYSTVAYQGYGRGFDLKLLESFNECATGGLKPALVVFLDMDPEDGLKRKSEGRDRFERQELDFHLRVREGYLNMAAADPEQWIVINAMLPKKEIRELVWQRVRRLLH